MHEDVHATLHWFAERDGGVLTWEAARRAGLVPAEFANLVGRRHWPRMHRGVYIPDYQERTADIRARAAAAAVDVRSVTVSHATAAALHGIPLARHSDVDHVTVPRQARRPHRPRLRVHAHDLPPGDVMEIDGLAVTTPARTLLDLLLDGDRLTATWACEAAVRTGLATADQVRGRLAQARRVPGIVRARRRFALADGRSESVLETAIRLLLHDAGLPAPEVQLSIVDGAGREIFRLDLAYLAHRVALEADGREVHETPPAVLRDRWRQNDLANRGWTVLRFTWHDVTARPGYVVSVVRAALRARAA